MSAVELEIDQHIDRWIDLENALDRADREFCHLKYVKMKGTPRVCDHTPDVPCCQRSGEYMKGDRYCPRCGKHICPDCLYVDASRPSWLS